MSHSGVQFRSTTWSSAQDEHGVQLEVSCLSENETPGGQGTHVTIALDGMRLPHSNVRVCPGGQDGQFSHDVEPSLCSTQN